MLNVSSRLKVTLLTLLAAPLWAQSASVFATGLINPSKMIAGPSGSLLITEAGPTSGRISIVDTLGVRRTLIDGLPSGVSGPNHDPDGPNGLVLDGKTLYVAIGEGDELIPGTVSGTFLYNPVVPSSPVLDSVMQIAFGQAVNLASGFALTAADHSGLADGSSVTLDNGTGGKATVSILASFRPRPDSALIYRNSHPYGLTRMPGSPDYLFLTNAGLNSLVKVDTVTGHAETLAHFPNQPNRGAIGPPVTEAVPDNVFAFGNRLLVSFLTGFPFAAGNSKLMSVDPVTGASEVFLDNLTTAIDVAWRTRVLGRLQFYVLEYSANQLAQAPGRLKVFDPTERVLLDNLKGPSSMLLDAASGKLYITTRPDGNLLVFDLGQ